MEHLAQARGFALDDERFGRKGQRDVRAQIVVQREHVVQEGAEVDRLHRSRARLPRVDRKVVDHVLHRGDLRDDRLRAARQRLPVGPFEAPRELALEALGRELDRRQRVLDLVREPARDLAPRRVALRLREIGDVVEHDDVAGDRRDRQARAAHQQRAHQVRDRQLRLLLPLRVAARAKALGDELGERRQRRQLAPPVGERGAGQLGERLLQDHRGARVGRAQPVAIVEREHAGREIAENALEVCARRLGRAARLLGLLLRLGELRRHRVERFGQHAELVARGHRLPAREIALRDRARALGEQTRAARRSAPTARPRGRAPR